MENCGCEIFSEKYENFKKKIAENLQKKLNLKNLDEKKIAEILIKNNFEKKICAEKIAEFLKIEKNLAENFGAKKLENSKIFENKIAEKCCSGAEKIEQKFCAADFKNGENFEIEKNLVEILEKNNFKNFSRIFGEKFNPK